ncbi:unnamed protein product [Cercopithifilaria johnstoni]|uniref:Uncharacterized protein n=1 Tax=Cercopithifilaria johnstoni TaxID=2874296 RepID=A0A8J2Q009_9BILA|nr:unnamed protein product [Cercopithifilaria johnstoni]
MDIGRLEPLETLEKDYYLDERNGWYSDGEQRDSERLHMNNAAHGLSKKQLKLCSNEIFYEFMGPELIFNVQNF